MPAPHQPRESKSSERMLEAVERQRRALELRILGKSYAEIAEEVGYAGSSGAFQAIMSALKRTLREPAEAVRTLELARLDKIMIPAFNAAIGGSKDGIETVLKIMQRRAKLQGLDAPASAVVVNANPAAAEKHESIQQIMQKILSDPVARELACRLTEGELTNPPTQQE